MDWSIRVNPAVNDVKPLWIRVKTLNEFSSKMVADADYETCAR